jgi:hypothetical protein
MKIIKFLLALIWYPFFMLIFTVFFALGGLTLIIAHKTNKNWAFKVTGFIAAKLEELSNINDKVKS